MFYHAYGIAYSVDVKDYHTMFVLNTLKTKYIFTHQQMITLVIVIILLICQAQFSNFPRTHHEINILQMFYFASLSVYKDGGAHCLALRTYALCNKDHHFRRMLAKIRSKMITTGRIMFT